MNRQNKLNIFNEFFVETEHIYFIFQMPCSEYLFGLFSWVEAKKGGGWKGVRLYKDKYKKKTPQPRLLQ